MPVASQHRFADRLRELRSAAGITPYDLAKRAGITNQMVYRLESGEREPSWETVRKLAKALGKTVQDFDVLEPETEPISPEPQPRPMGKGK